MNEKLVTVVVPIYNVEKYLNCCIESIVNQTYKKLEIILVDDGSPDSCPGMCDEWAKRDSRIIVIHKENQGLGLARNTGLEYANGEYVCFVDSDDYIDEETISQTYDAITSNNADFVIFGHYHVFRDNTIVSVPINHKKTVFTGQEVMDELLPWMIQSRQWKERKCPYAFSAWSGIVRRAILEEHKIRFPSERRIISEDTIYLLELYSKLKVVVVIPKCFYGYRLNSESLTQKYQRNRCLMNNEFLSVALELIKKERYCKEVSIRVIMMYHGFTMEAMKHIIRIKRFYRDAKPLLMEFVSNFELRRSINKEVLIRCSILRAVFLLFLKWKLVPFCWLLLWLREKKR